MWDGVNRRRFRRAEYPCLITLRKNTPPAQAVLAHTENISLAGVSVIVSRRLELLTEVDLEIDLKDTLPNIVTKGLVGRVKQAASSRQSRLPRYDLGIKFIALEPEDRRRIQHIVEHVQRKRR